MAARSNCSSAGTFCREQRVVRRSLQFESVLHAPLQHIENSSMSVRAVANIADNKLID